VAFGITFKSDGEDGSDTKGVVRIYKWNDISWNQLGGDIVGEDDGDYAGASVSMNASGNIVAIGAPDNTAFGHIRIYKLVDQLGDISRNKLGQDIDGWVDNTGYGVSMNASGNIVAIGAPGNFDGGRSDMFKSTNTTILAICGERRAKTYWGMYRGI
jgi:hypothetical protein